MRAKPLVTMHHDYQGFIDFIRDYKSRNPEIISSFLDNDNMLILEWTITNYEKIFYQLANCDNVLIAASKTILKKNIKERSKEECHLLSFVFNEQTRFVNYQKIINELNTPELFWKFVNKDNLALIEKIHHDWERNSHFSAVFSEHFIVIINSLDSLETYIQLIVDCPKSRQDNPLQLMVHHVQKQIKSDRTKLLYAMLGRLKNSRQFSVDDVVLNTLTALTEAGLETQYLENTRHCFSERGTLSNACCRLFQDYILQWGNKKIIEELTNLYLGKNLPPIEINRTMPSFENRQMMYSEVSNVIWEKTNFKAANLMGSIFSKANLQSSIFHSANISSSLMEKVNLSCANLIKTQAKCVNFTDANLQWVDASEAIFAGSIFQYANLQGANFYRADLQDVDFSHADLRWANLAEADFSRIKIEETRLDYARFFVDLKASNVMHQLDKIHEKIASNPHAAKLALAVTADLIREAKKCSQEEANQILQIAYQHKCLKSGYSTPVIMRFFGGSWTENINQKHVKEAQDEIRSEYCLNALPSSRA